MSASKPVWPIRADDPGRGEGQPGPEPAGVAQHHDGRPLPRPGRELRGELLDAADVGTAEAVDRLVGIADHHEVAAVTGERLEQRDLAGIGVLVLVDEHVAVAPAQLVAVGARLDDRAPDQVGVVGRTEVVEDREVLVQEDARRDELGQPVRLAERAQLVAVELLLAGPAQHGLHLAHEAVGAERPLERLRPRAPTRATR